jgi:pimeloyl-ACP methyl ester carboxylesterase
VQDANTLLKNAGITGPYVLFGWSFGGLLVRLYASEHSQDVVGIVLADGTPDTFTERLVAILPEQGSRWVNDFFYGNGIDAKATEADMRQAAALPNIPFIVMTAANRADMWGDGWPADKVKQAEAMWMELQHDMVQRVPGGTQVIVSGGHDIPDNHTGEVIKAITTMVTAIRTKK